MLYVTLIVFGYMVVRMVREQGKESRERDYMNDFYRSEYQRSFLVTN